MPVEVMLWLVAPIPERTFCSKKNVTEIVWKALTSSTVLEPLFCIEVYMAVIKGKIRKKDSAIDIGADFKKLADEYTALMKYRYKFVLEDLEDIDFRFSDDGFFHLLGFHKIKDATIVELVEGKKVIAKDVFYKNVVDGNINYNYLDIDSILDEEEKVSASHKGVDITSIKTYKDTIHYKSELGKVISNRWLCFSKDRILNIFGRRLVLDFDKDDHNSLIDADRVFFQFLKDKGRHVNLFVKYNSDDNAHYPVTFFLEDTPDSFTKKSDGARQRKINILVKRITDIHTNADIDVEIIWSNVREELKTEPEFYAQKDLFTVFSNNYHIKSKELEEKIAVVKEQVPQIPDIFKRMENKELALECVAYYEKYLIAETKDEKEEVETFFMELDECIDIEDKETHNQFVGDCSRKALKRYNQIVRYENMLPLLLKLELMEVRYIYGKFFDVSEWSDDFIRELIDVHNCYGNELSLSRLEKLAKERYPINDR
ncbi:hypothetical protein KHM83_11065 [Fusibacter paucivorans]|uniref:Phage replication initiation protein n=1 Tax=Fusibacter paucivorans TaxID=76009 RepID=A0ABS5PRL7_9FIRM|nr:hypothetical protein [Fusibacter paucivorans]MBS7527221.1 hypothetical protein [Fusibacter paucivorans]